MMTGSATARSPAGGNQDSDLDKIWWRKVASRQKVYNFFLLSDMSWGSFSLLPMLQTNDKKHKMLSRSENGHGTKTGLLQNSKTEKSVKIRFTTTCLPLFFLNCK